MQPNRAKEGQRRESCQYSSIAESNGQPFSNLVYESEGMNKIGMLESIGLVTNSCH